MGLNKFLKTNWKLCVCFLLLLFGFFNVSILECTAAFTENASSICASDLHELVLLSNGTVWAWGSNSCGECGQEISEDNSDFSSPKMVNSLSDIREVSTGLFASFALANDGTVWSWGSNIAGQLGRGFQVTYSTSDYRWKPEPIPGLSNVIAIASSPQGFALALKDDGTVWAWGYNNFGQLGNGAVPIGEYAISPVQVEGLGDVKSIAAGYKNAFAVKNDGTVWAWGSASSVFPVNDGNKAGIARLPQIVPDITDVKSMAIDDGYALLLKNDGTVWAWGSDWRGALGINSSKSNTPDNVITSTPIQVPGLSDVVAIDVSNGHSVALCRDGSVWSWGANYGGQLGDGSIEDRNKPWRIPVKNIVLISGSYMVDSEGNIYKCDKNGVSRLDFKFNSGNEGPQQSMNSTEETPAISEQPVSTEQADLFPSEQANSTPGSSSPLPGGNSILMIGVVLFTVILLGLIVYLVVRK
ncbi:RCC1 domain-containing protein [Methanocella sp. MCL-LM]|uniref:RCC1 domain-containing protein n=1 Tax=Methanocella sp. MCL-LM TaxID=3412035 RepID=UPI003C74E724